MLIDSIDTVAFFFKRLRVFPRLFIIGYAIILHIMINWVIGLPDITTAQAIVTSAMVTIATPITKFYIDSGNNLYDYYSDMVYSYRIEKIIDLVGYIVDKMRLVPLLFVIHFTVTLVILLFWAFGLGDALTTAQATFISVFAGNASMVLGFYITSDSKNKEFEDQYKKRVGFKEIILDNSNVITKREH